MDCLLQLLSIFAVSGLLDCKSAVGGGGGGGGGLLLHALDYKQLARTLVKAHGKVFC